MSIIYREIYKPIGQKRFCLPAPYRHKALEMHIDGLYLPVNSTTPYLPPHQRCIRLCLYVLLQQHYGINSDFSFVNFPVQMIFAGQHFLYIALYIAVCVSS